MPGYIIHLAQAKMIEERMFLNNRIPDYERERWKSLFEYGSLLPDAAQKENKFQTHFIEESDKEFVIRTPNLATFMNKYSQNINTPLFCGYFAHLYLDYTFFHNFLPQYVSFFNEKGKEEKILGEISYVLLHKSQEKISLKDFFSEKYLYGDYTKLNRYFIEKYNLQIPENQGGLCVDIEEASDCNFEILIHKLSKFLGNSKKLHDKTKVFLPQDLESFLQNTAEKFLLLSDEERSGE